MSMFKKLGTEELAQEKDTLGGGGFVKATGLYRAIIKAAYAGQSSGGAMNVTVIFTLEDNTEYQETFYVTSGRDKGQKNYYEKDGKKRPLPGFTQVNDLCILTTEQMLSEQDTEEKVLEIWNSAEGKKMPTSVDCLTALHGQEVVIGLIKKVTNKNKKNESTNEYEPTNEKREFNELNKAFHAETLQTVSEAMNQQDASFHEGWAKKYNADYVDDKFETVAESGRPTRTAPAKAAPAAGAAAPKTGGGLFNKNKG